VFCQTLTGRTFWGLELCARLCYMAEDMGQILNLDSSRESHRALVLPQRRRVERSGKADVKAGAKEDIYRCGLRSVLLCSLAGLFTLRRDGFRMSPLLCVMW
jgi:hypothetical protein